MGLEIRPARPEEMEEFGRVAMTSLGNPGEMRPEIIKAIDPEWTVCAFEDGKLATAYAAWPLTMRFNGNGVSVAGVTHVGTLPIYRRRGYLRKVIASHLEILHERGEQPIALLFASRAAIYQRYGYAVVSTRSYYSVEPRYLQFSINQPVSGTLREVGDDEFGLLVDIYRDFRAERTGYIHRARLMWEAGVLAPSPSGSLLSKIVYEESGEPRGYVIYVVEPEPAASPGPMFRLTIRDFVWLTPSAYRAMWEHFVHMDLVSRVVWERAPSDDPLPHLVLEPRMLRMTSADGLLSRIIDVEKALSGRRYSDEGTLTFEILDDLCSWNSRRWKLEASAAEASVGPTSDKPQLVMRISTLAMLVFGQINASEAARMGRLDVLDRGALSSWDKVMRTAHRPSCADLF